MKSILDIKQEIKNCGVRFKIFSHHCGARVGTKITCRSRFCVACAKKRGAKMMGQYMDWLKTFKLPSLVTLTIPNFHDPNELKAKIDLMIESFRELRRQKYVSNKSNKRLKVWDCDRGLWSLEVTYSKEKGFHPHFHIIADSKWIDQKQLSKAWEKLTGGKIVHVKRIEIDEGSVRELFKYTLKPWEIPDDVLELMIEAFRGKRLINWVGKSAKIKAKKEKKKMICPKCFGSENWSWEDMGPGMVDEHKKHIWLFYYEDFAHEHKPKGVNHEKRLTGRQRMVLAYKKLKLNQTLGGVQHGI